MKRTKTNSILIAAIAAVIGAGLASQSLVGIAYAHPHLVVTPDESDHEQANAKPVVLTLGHSNEPSFGAKPGIHDGKHNVELSIEDAATTMPIAGANLTLDRYYFADLRSFERATSVNDATEIDTGIPLRGVFGEPGIYSVRQIVKEGIYGYRVYGTIDYFEVGKMPIDSTVFCTTPQGNTSKFNSPGWEGSYGCVSDIDSLLFPSNNIDVMRIDSGEMDKAKVEQASIVTSPGTLPEQDQNRSMPSELYQYMILGLSGIGAAAFFGARTLKRRKDEGRQD